MLKHLLLLLLYFNTAHAQEAYVKYELSPNPAQDSLQLRLNFKGSASGKTTIYVPVLGGFNREEKQLVATSNGSNLKIEIDKRTKTCLKNYPQVCHVASIHHKSKADITLTYKPEKSNGIFISKNNVVFNGSALLIFPIVEDSNKRIALDWSALKFKHAKIISPTSIQSMPKAIVADRDTLASNNYVSTNLDINSSKLKPNLLVTSIGFADSKKQFTHQHLSKLSEKITTGNEKFLSKTLGKFNKHKPKSIIIINQDDRKHNCWRGTKLGDSYFVLIDERNDDYNSVAYVISHEHLHELFGPSLQVNFGKGLEYGAPWFFEGFTHYYTSLLNYRNGIITKKQYIKEINKTIEDYYKFYRPFQKLATTTCNRKAPEAANVLSSETLYPIFYKAGILIALELDNLIQTLSHGKADLDDFIKNLVQSSCKEIPCPVGKEQFVAELSKVIGSKEPETLKSYIDTYVVDFLPLNLPDVIQKHGLILDYKEVEGGIYYGFDVDKTPCTGLISGVKKQSNAYKAGLRNGMVAANLKFSDSVGDGGQGPYKLMLEVEIQQPDLTKRTIRYDAYSKITIPYYKPKELDLK